MPRVLNGIAYPEVPMEKTYQKNVYAMQCKRYEVFKQQNLEAGRFDVTFEIEGKQLHAHKFILTSVSGPFDAWLTDRWTAKDAVIKVEDYSYDCFYQFVSFVYSGNCDLSNENVLKMVDMAEFYDIPCLKRFCDDFLSKTDILTRENVEEMYEFAKRYSLISFILSVRECVCENMEALTKSERMNNCKKSFVEFMFSVGRLHPYDVCRLEFESCISEETFFEAVYKWAENQAIMQTSNNDSQDFSIPEAVRTELSEFLPRIKFYNMRWEFLMNIVVEKGCFLSPFELYDFFLISRKYSVNEQKLFKNVYDLAEKQLLQKQEMSPIDLIESVKADLAKIIPLARYYKMEQSFLMDFIVPKRILTAEEASHVFDTRVQITNCDRIITGVFKDNLGILRAIEKRKRFDTKQQMINKARYTSLKFPIPSTPSTVMKMKGVEWYLCLEKDEVFALKHHNLIERSDYLLAQMENNPEFELETGFVTSLTASYRNV
uniref:BTB domain-containing protein n=1 Tax=Panagrolaimus sp. ES5 TaxID=591445 RepID=A0AC34FY11_9BILA